MMHTVVPSVLAYLMNALWQIPLVYATAWCVARLLRSAGADLKHRVWVGALLAQCFLPACSFHVSVAWVEFGRLLGVLGLGMAGRAGTSVAFGPATAVGSMHLSSPVLAAGIAVYAVFILLGILRFLWGTWQVHVLRSSALSIALSPESASFWQTCARGMGVRHARIAAATGISGPLTIGIRRKLMLVPVQMFPGLDDACLEAAMAHELSHMQRSDFAKNLLYELLALPIAWHPLLWVTRAQVIETREVVCDRLASQAVGGELPYARSLLLLASRLVVPTPAAVPHAIGIFDAHQLERRIDMLTSSSAPLRGVRRLALSGISLILALTACGSALAMRLSVNGAVPALGAGPRSTAPGPNTTKNGDDTVRLSSAVVAANVLHKIAPIYPAEAKAGKIQGAVVLSAVIGKDGSVEQLTAISGPEQLRQSALDAVHQWTYKPYLLNGQPVAVETTITITYSFGE